ncbi:sulfatase-like hydrolase/transferase [Vibrio vulnificus]|uniref:sulfatase-like hydrolase/transferase n=1 Tax=Vibrio vulnificus TaxID=672 RepID=UPI001CDC6C05|nr:sulfatase-like hydrolase/transferase [Vibrio vulnificus]MCA3901212.1 sulfatase-like hydrolase/transferase [Vibrio vulnificus]
MNFALLLMDQTRADMLGCYGHPVVQTPNMDSIAAAGARFEQAFCASSVCTPSRTSLFTGKMPSHHGVMCNSDKEGDKCDVPLEDANLISELPNHQHIYIGKWHIGHQKLPQEYGFVGHNFDGYAYPGSGVYQNLAFDSVPLNGNRYQEWLQEKGFALPKVSDCTFGNNPNLKIQEFYGLLHAPVEASIPFFLVDEAISHIEKCLKQNQPFTLWMNFWGPHTPCIIPEPYFSMYQPEQVTFDESFYHPLIGKPEHYQNIAKMWGVWSLDEEIWRHIVCKYWGYITLIDDAIGQLLDFLKQRDLYDALFLSISADHGDAMGAHRMIEKGEFMFDQTYRVPLIIKDPKASQIGAHYDDLVYLHDLTATYADIASAKVPDSFDGQSLLPILRQQTGQSVPARAGILAQQNGHFTPYPQRMWRTKEYKLVFNASGRSELYHLHQDPQEMHNLIDDPNYGEIKQSMIEAMYAEMQRYHDPLCTWFYRMKAVI